MASPQRTDMPSAPLPDGAVDEQAAAIADRDDDVVAEGDVERDLPAVEALRRARRGSGLRSARA